MQKKRSVTPPSVSPSKFRDYLTCFTDGLTLFNSRVITSPAAKETKKFNVWMRHQGQCRLYLFFTSIMTHKNLPIDIKKSESAVSANRIGINRYCFSHLNNTVLRTIFQEAICTNSIFSQKFSNQNKWEKHSFYLKPIKPLICIIPEALLKPTELANENLKILAS
jgi:hypothetical protein